MNSNMKRLKIWYSDLWPNFYLENLFEIILKKHYILELTSNNPDLLIFGPFSGEYKKIKAQRKLYWTGENRRLNFEDYNYGIGFDYIQGDNYLRFPLWKYLSQLSENRGDLLLPKKQDLKTNFCAFIVSSENGQERKDFYNLLTTYKKIDSFGTVYNNRQEILRLKGNTAPEWQYQKIKYLKKNNYKFIISFENSSHPGYCTEKIFDAMLANTVPIYWGDATACKNFNEKSFIDGNRFLNQRELMQYVIEMDNNDYLYNNMYKQPYMTIEQSKYLFNNELEEFLLKILREPPL